MIKIQYKHLIYSVLFLCVPLWASSKSVNVVENEFIRMHVSSSGVFSLVDKQHQTEWSSKWPGWASLSEGGKRYSCSLETSCIDITRIQYGYSVVFKGISGRDYSDSTFTMRLSIQLKDKYVDLEIVQLESVSRIEHVEYPAHLLSFKTGTEQTYLAVPNLQGILIPGRYDAGFMRCGQNIWDMIADIEKVWPFESGMLNMPWFGASRGGSTLMATVLTSADCQLRVLANCVVGKSGMRVDARQGRHPGTRIASLTPIWLSEKGRLAYSRKLRLEFVDGGYVGMAKRYREEAVASGRLVTMREKIQRNPEYQKIIGAPDIKLYVDINRLNQPYYKAWSEPVLTGYSRVMTSFDQAAEISDDLAAMGVEKCMILLGGWNRMGYDREHVDMWPPSERAGGIQGLRQACQRVRDHGYLFALHDNYNDFYPDAPSYDVKYIVKRQDGSIRLGGVWDGGLCHVMCSAVQRQFLNRNLNLILEAIPLNGYYFDVVTSVSPYECYDTQHPNTRQDDLRHRSDLFEEVRSRGLVVGGERGCDWAMPAAAFYEGMQGGGTGYHRGAAYRIGLTVPLFYLVYHDCVVGYWQHGTPFGREDHANHLLLDLLCAQPSSWSLVYEQWDDLKGMIKETYELLSPLHRQTAFQKMVDHQVHTLDWMVQSSKFEDGTEVFVNYGLVTFSEQNIVIPPKGFRIQFPGQPIIEGIAGREIVYPSREK